MTLSSVLVKTRPCLFSATHWYIPMSDSFRLLMVISPLVTWTLSYKTHTHTHTHSTHTQYTHGHIVSKNTSYLSYIYVISVAL